MFNVGDTIKCTNTGGNVNLTVNKHYTALKCQYGTVGILADNGEVLEYYCSRFEIVEPKPQFDLKKNPWFIRTGTKEKSEETQKWLFGQGIGWIYFRERVNQYDENFLTNVRDNGEVTGYIMHAQERHESAQEITLKFETVIKSVKYPEVMTEQDKKIQELKETIEKAQQQIKELQGINS